MTLSAVKRQTDAYTQNKQDEYKIGLFHSWLNGKYAADAIMATVMNSSWFSGKGGGHFKYPENPLDKLEAERELTEEEKIKYTEQLFTSLDLMKTNYELSHDN